MVRRAGLERRALELRHREVDAAADRGAVGERARRFQQLVAELARRALRPPITVQSITTFCALDARPFDEADGDAPVAARADRVEHARVGDRGGIALALQLEFRLVDAARDVGGEHQQQIDRLGGARDGCGDRPAPATRKRDTNALGTSRRSLRTGTTERSLADSASAAPMAAGVCAIPPRIGVPGNATSTSVPALTALLMLKVARLASASALVSGRPSPVPPEPKRAEVASCRNGSSAVSMSFSLMPTPVSRTRSTTSPWSVTRGRDDHLSAGAGELDRVRQQIEHDLAHRARVGDDRRQRRRQRGADDDALAVGLRLHQRDALLRQFVEVDAGEVQVELAGLDLGQVEQVVEQRDQMPAGGVDVLEILL